MPHATLRTDTSGFQQSIRYSLERKASTSHARHWYSPDIHPMDPILLQRPRRARVQLFNVFSSSRRFTQGLPQGSVLAPLLFLLYINNLASSLNNDAVLALFADDVSILTTARKNEDAEAAAQSVVNYVLIWSQVWKLNLNADKSEVCPFSTWSNDSSWKPNVFIGTQKIRVNVTPRLLGVILDRSLTFNPHLKKLTSSLSSSFRFIRATAHTSWGWRCLTLKMAFHVLIRSKLDYAAPAWQPWLSATNLSSLDHLQNRSLRLITGQLVSTPLEGLRLEVCVQSYQTCSNRLILKASEKDMRSSDDHPKRVALATNIPQRLQNRCSFRHKFNEFSTLFPPGLQHRQSINHFSSRPWQLNTSCEGRISTTVPGSLVELITWIKNDIAASPLLLPTRLTTQSTPMDPLVEGRETGVQQQSSPGDPELSLKWSPSLRPKEEPLQAPTRKKRLPWNQL